MERITPYVLAILSAVVLLAMPATAADEPQVVLLDGSGLSWQGARRIVETSGGEVAHVLPPSVLVGRIPETAEILLRRASGAAPATTAAAGAGLRVVRGRAQARVLLAPAATPAASLGPALSSEAVAALRLLAPEDSPARLDPTLRVTPDGGLEVLPPSAWEEPPLVRPKLDPRLGAATSAIGNTFYSTSDFMAGDVAVAVLRPESTGVVDPSSQDWTTEEVSYTLTQVVAALDLLRSDSPRGKLTFVYRTETSGVGVAGTVSCDYEAAQRGNWDDGVVLDVLGKLGYTQATPYNRLTEWVNDARSDLGTDWGVGLIVADDSASSSGGRASAWLNGPASWTFVRDGAWVYHHEAGHIWGALDEYHPDAAQSPTALGGYTQEVNANSEYNDGTGYFGGAGEGLPALMHTNIAYASPWTRGQWGIWDLDGDGVNETQDTFPGVTLTAPAGTSTLTFAGTASATPLARETALPWDSATVTVNRIARVEWRLDGGPWQDAAPSDGAFDGSSEGFTFTAPSLKNGPYLFEARAVDNFGNATQRFPRRIAVVSASPVTNNPPQASVVAARTAGSTATLFRFSGSGSRDIEDGTNLQYRWDLDADGTWDTALSASPDATHTYASPGAYEAVLEVRDTAGLGTTRRVGIVVAGANLAPTASFTVDRGAVFASAPVVFTLDASGSSDGEDAADALQVRWDFENDGTWDTTFSTTKTATHDYALGSAVSVSFEAGDTYLYLCCSANGYAQSFVAASTAIGAAEAVLLRYIDYTPGGTVTVGIRSSLTGAFLTSVVRDQADLVRGDWTRFDFPDVAVTKGATYYLVVLSSDADVSWLSYIGDAYPGGSQHYTSDGGASWTTRLDRDQVFRIYDAALVPKPLSRSSAWRVRMEVKDSSGQTAETVRDIWANGYDKPPTVSLASSATNGPPGTTFDLTATAADPDSATVWDGLLLYRWDADGDGNFETEFGSASTRSVTLTEPGTYDATVEVRDRYHAKARATLRLTIDPPALTLSDVAVTEGDAGTTTATFTVSLSRAADLPVTAAWTTRDGTALAGSDYVAAGGTLTIPAGSTTQTIGVSVNGDLAHEADETFFVDLTAPTNATIADGTAVGTITDDDAAIVVIGTRTKSVGAPPYLPGGPVSYTITLTNVGGVTQPDNPGPELVDVLPSALTVVSASASSGTAVVTGSTVSWNGAIPSGGTVTLSIDATVEPSATMGTSVSNQATIHYDSNVDGTNESTVLSDDPAVGGAQDPTRFAVESGEVEFYTLTPCRLLDTREATGPLGGPALGAGALRTFSLAQHCGIPANAKALSVNATVTQATAPGNLRLFQAGTDMPPVSTINYVPGVTRANNAITPLSSSGEVAVFCTQTSGTVHFILDVNGYFE